MSEETKESKVGYTIPIPELNQDRRIRNTKDIEEALEEEDSIVISARVTKISDGDTYHCYDIFDDDGSPKDRLKIRVLGIDRPEMKNNFWGGQPLAPEATEKLRDMIEDKVVLLKIMGLDKYKRVLGLTYYKCDYWRNISCELARCGLASVYRNENKTPTEIDDVLDELEELAKSEKLGVWGLRDYESPRDYRRRMRK